MRPPFSKDFFWWFSHVFYRSSSVSFFPLSEYFQLKISTLTTLSPSWFIDFHVSSRGKLDYFVRMSNVRCHAVRVDQPTVNESLCLFFVIFFTLNVTWLSVCIGSMAENENDMMRKWPFSLVLFTWTEEWDRTGKRFKKTGADAIFFIGREIEMGQSENRSWNLTSVIQVDGRGFFQLGAVRRRRRYLVIICHGMDSKRRRRFLTSAFLTGQSVPQQLASVPPSQIVFGNFSLSRRIVQAKSELDPICESYPAAQ